jgi:Autophagy protein ATG5, UblB domain
MNSIPIIINFNNNFNKYQFPLMISVPRTSLFAAIFSHIHDSIFKNKLIEENQNIKLSFTDKENKVHDILWYLPVGAFFDIKIKDNYKIMELECDKSDKNGLFQTPINDIKTMVQQRFKHGLGTIFNGTKIFIELPVKEIEDYVSFSISTKYNFKSQINFCEMLQKMYQRKQMYRIPFIFHHQDKLYFYAPDVSENADETLSDTIMRSGFDVEILSNKKNKIFINGLEINDIKDTPILWAIKNLCCADLFIHVAVIGISF